MAKKEKTPEQQLASLKRYLNKQIKFRKDILGDGFMRSNLMDMELGMFATEARLYQEILDKLK
jgi:hypothetical protein